MKKMKKIQKSEFFQKSEFVRKYESFQKIRFFSENDQVMEVIKVREVGIAIEVMLVTFRLWRCFFWNEAFPNNPVKHS